MRLITKLANLLRPGKIAAPAAVYQLNIFCVHADLTMLRVQAAKQLHAHGLEVERIALTAGDNELACLSVLFTCPDAASRSLNQLAAHFVNCRRSIGYTGRAMRNARACPTAPFYWPSGPIWRTEPHLAATGRLITAARGAPAPL